YFPGKVLNQAVSEAETEWVVFINSDVVLLDPYAIERLIEPLYEAKTAATFGRQVVRPEASLLVRHDYARAFPDSPEHPEWMHYSLPIAAMKKSVWETIPFYTDAWGSEDTHWGKHAKEQGYKVVYVHDAVAMHSHNYTLKQLASRRRIEGEADVYIYPGKQSSLLSAISTYIKSTLREGWHYLINGKLLGIPYLLADRFVYVWHYHQGVVHAREKKSITFGNYQKSL
ncbi:MAG TPA: glycosyltransferase, partial [Epsilonproteobacteria bacterium]|nr:glycosyltransferase [Campylobacterota bacterium]